MNQHPIFSRKVFKGILAIFAVLSFHSPSEPYAQTASVTATHQIETVQNFVAGITPSEKQQFDVATGLFSSHQYADALLSFKSLLSTHPGEPVLIKFASEAALLSGDASFAVNQLKAVMSADPNDWQALALLTRADAESGDKVGRDACMAQMVVLHKGGIAPPSLQQYQVERIRKGENTLIIWTSLEPWGYYKVYDFGQVLDSKGAIFLRISLESSDADQPLFARQHPKEASQGLRGFSLDAYRETGKNDAGQRTQTHYTFQFFAGQPSYDTVRDRFQEIVNGRAVPISSRSNLIVP